MHHLSTGQTTTQRSILQQKVITQDQALNFLRQKQLQLMNDDTSAFDALSSNNNLKMSNLAEKDKFMRTSVQIKQQPIQFSASVKNTHRRQSIYQNQIAIRGLSTTIQHKNQNEQQDQNDQRISTVSQTSRIQTASTATLGYRGHLRQSNQYPNGGMTSMFDINNSPSHDNLLASKGGLRQTRKIRPVTANTSPANFRNKIQSGEYLQKDRSDIDLRSNQNQSFVGITSTKISKSRLSLNMTQQQDFKRLRNAGSKISMSNITFMNKSNKALLINKNDTNSVWNFSHSVINFPGSKQSTSSPVSFSPSRFKIQKQTDKPDQVFSTEQINQVFESKLEDNSLPYQNHAFQHFLDHCSSNCVNGKIDLQDQYLGQKSAIKIAKLVLNSKSIFSLNLTKNKVGDHGVQKIAEALSRQNHLVALNLSNNQISHKGCKSLFEHLARNNGIVDLNLASNEGPNKNILGAKGAEWISHYFTEMKARSVLCFLNLKGCSFGNEGIIKLSEGLRCNYNLLNLNLRGNLFTKIGLEILVISLPKSLIELDISDNNLKDSGLRIISDVLFNGCDEDIIQDDGQQKQEEEEKQQNDQTKQKQQPKKAKKKRIKLNPEDIPELIYLNISKCGFSIKGLEYLFNDLKYNGDLKTLILDQNSFEGKRISFIDKFLIFNNSIEKLSMNDCEIGDEFAVQIGKGLLKNSKIKGLYLSNNYIDNEGVIEIAKALRFNLAIQLKVLDLSHNNLKDQAAKELSHSIRLNKSLENLNLKQNNIFIEGGHSLAQSMLDNKTIKSINAEENIFYFRYIEKMKECSKRNLIKYQESEFPRFQHEKQRLSKIKAQHAIFQMIKKEVEKEEMTELQKLKKVKQEFEKLKEEEKISYDFQVKKVQETKEQVKVKERELFKVIAREEQMEANGDKQIKDIIHFSHNFDKDKAYIQDDINYLQQQLQQRRAVFKEECSKLSMELFLQSEREKKAQQRYQNVQKDLQAFMKKNNIPMVQNLNLQPMATGGSDITSKSAKQKRNPSSRRNSRKGSQENIQITQEKQDMQEEEIKNIGEEIKKGTKKKRKSRKAKSRNKKNGKTNTMNTDLGSDNATSSRRSKNTANRSTFKID